MSHDGLGHLSFALFHRGRVSRFLIPRLVRVDRVFPRIGKMRFPPAVLIGEDSSMEVTSDVLRRRAEEWEI